MRVKSNKRTKVIAILFVLIMLISVGYAFLSTQLTINGIGTLKSNNWNIYFTNVQIKEGSIEATTAPTTEGTSTTELNWAVSMDTPGQFYEYNVDVVNGGTIDAMVATATNEIVTTTLTADQQKYLDYSIKYVNGASVDQYDKLAAGETKTITVKLAFKDDIEAADLPSTDQTGIALSYTANYVQADDRAVEKATTPQQEIEETAELHALRAYFVGNNIGDLVDTSSESVSFINNETLADASSIEIILDADDMPDDLELEFIPNIESEKLIKYKDTLYILKDDDESFISVNTASDFDRVKMYFCNSICNGTISPNENFVYPKDSKGIVESDLDLVYMDSDGRTYQSMYSKYNNKIYELSLNMSDMTVKVSEVDNFNPTVLERLNTYFNFLYSYDPEKNVYTKDQIGVLDSDINVLSDPSKGAPVSIEYKGKNYFVIIDEVFNMLSVIEEDTYYNDYISIIYDKNSEDATGTMTNQLKLCGVETPLKQNKYKRVGYGFAGWNTEPDGSGTAYTDGQSVSLTKENGSTLTLYAQWGEQEARYAVQIYGINQDVDANGNTLGLTFGPATGANYNNSYVTHKYEETSEGSGEYYVKIVTHTVPATGSETTSEEYLYKNGGTTEKVTRTQAQVNARTNISLHDMTWAEIKAVPDKTLFEDCMLCGDTKSVKLSLNSTIASGNQQTARGDGAGMLLNSINEYYIIWNPSQSQNSYVGTGVTLSYYEKEKGSNANNAGGYSSSHIRATLIGKDTKTNEGYAGDVNLSSDTCLYSCIESDLKTAITAKQVKYVTGTSSENYNLNNDITDKIWLFSEREMYGTGQYSGNTTEGIGATGDGYAKFTNSESKYYMSSASNGNNTKMQVYYEINSTTGCWLRSLSFSFGESSACGFGSGYIGENYVNCGGGLAFGFCID